MINKLIEVKSLELTGTIYTKDGSWWGFYNDESGVILRKLTNRQLCDSHCLKKHTETQNFLLLRW